MTMELKQKLKCWWFRQTRKMYLRAGGQLITLNILRVIPRRIQAEIKYEVPKHDGIYPDEDSIERELARRIGRIMIQKGLVEIEQYSDVVDHNSSRMTSHYARILTAYVLKPEDVKLDDTMSI